MAQRLTVTKWKSGEGGDSQPYLLHGARAHTHHRFDPPQPPQILRWSKGWRSPLCCQLVQS